MGFNQGNPSRINWIWLETPGRTAGTWDAGASDRHLKVREDAKRTNGNVAG
jgi:hypothetical protein